MNNKIGLILECLKDRDILDGLFENTAEPKRVDWKKEEMVDLLNRNDKAVLRALKVIYALQTKGEQDRGRTEEYNGVGFSGRDSEFLSSLAAQYNSKGTLSSKQIASARKSMVKYAGQLAKIANGTITVNV